MVHVVSGHARTANDHIGSLNGGGFTHKTILSALPHPLVCAGQISLCCWIIDWATSSWVTRHRRIVLIDRLYRAELFFTSGL